MLDTMHSRLTPVADTSLERDLVPGRRSGDRATDRAFHGLEGFFPHPLAGEAGSPLNIVGRGPRLALQAAITNEEKFNDQEDQVVSLRTRARR